MVRVIIPGIDIVKTINSAQTKRRVYVSIPSLSYLPNPDSLAVITTAYESLEDHSKLN
jgi:hypothetical protein